MKKGSTQVGKRAGRETSRVPMYTFWILKYISVLPAQNLKIEMSKDQSDSDDQLGLEIASLKYHKDM